MHRWILTAALSLSACFQIFSQTTHCEADWFNFRLEWAGRYERIEPVYDQIAIVWRDGLCGISDREGNLLLPIQYHAQFRYPVILRKGDHFAGVRSNGSVWAIDDCDHVSISCNSAWIVGKNGLQGLRDSTLQHLILPHQYISIACYDKSIYATDTSGHILEFDYSGRRIDSSDVTQLSNGLFIRRNDKRHCALASADGTLLTDYIFQHLVPVCDGSFWATLRNAKPQPSALWMWQRFQHYDAQGKPLSDPPCQRMLQETDGGMIKVVRDNRYEIWDGCGQQILPGASWEISEQYSHNFEDPEPEPFLLWGVTLFKKDNLLGVFLNAGKKTILPQYRRIYAAPGKIIACRATGGTDWYDRSGNLLRTTSDSIVGRSDPSWRRFFIAGKGGLMGVIDAEGREVILPKYRYLRMVGSGCYAYPGDNGERLLDPSGEEIPLPPGYRFDKVCGNYILFRRDMVGGLTDLRGRMVLPPRYDWLSPMNDNFLFYFKGKNDLYGLVNAQGDTILPAVYRQHAIIPMSGYIFLEKDGLWGIVNYKGQLIQPFEYTEKSFNNHNIVLRKGGETFFFEPADGTVKPAGFEWKGWMPYDVVAARRGGQWGLLRSDLTVALPFEYDTIFYKENHIVARRRNRDQWYNEETGIFRAVEIDRVRVLEASFWATLFERNGKKGLQYPSGDTLPAIYDQIVLDYGRHALLATLKDGVCKVPGSDGQPGVSFTADSLRSFDIAYLLQYWHRGEAWLMNTANGAKRRMELLTGAGEVKKYMICADVQQPVAWEQLVAYRVREGNRERYVLLDSLLQDRVPADFDIDPKKYIYRPDGKLMLRIARNGREGLWDVDDRRWVFPCLYDGIEGIVQRTDRHARTSSLSKPGHIINYPTDFVRLSDKGGYGLGRISDGTVILPCIYDGINIHLTDGSLTQLSENGKYGFYRPADGKMLPPVYTNSLNVNPKGLISLCRGDIFGLADRNLDVIVPVEQKRIVTVGQYFAVQKDKLWGFYNREGNQIQPYQYSWLGKIEHSSKWIVQKQDKQALFDENLQALTSFEFDLIEQRLSPGGRLVCMFKKWDSLYDDMVSRYGVVDTFGTIILKPEFPSVSVCDSLCVVSNMSPGKFGIVRTDLSVVAPFVYDRIKCTGDGRFMVQHDHKWGLLDHDGKALTAVEFDNIEESEGRTLPYIVGKNEYYALVDRSGRLITGFDFDYAEGFHSGRAAVRRDGRWGYVDSTGRVVIALQYDYAGQFNKHRFAWVVQNGERMCIYIDGERIITGENQSQDARFFSNYNRFGQDGLTCPMASSPGLKDLFGRTVIRSDTLIIAPPQGTVCLYRIMKPGYPQSRCGLMALNGRIITPPLFDAAGDNFNRTNVILVKRDGKYGYLRYDGQIIAEFKYDAAAPFDRAGQAEVVLNGKTFVIDMSGKCVKNCD